MKWKIGKIEINNQIGLAPMAGISNPSYMKICEEMGVGWAVTELISAEAIVRNNKKTVEMLNGIDNLNIPVGVQIFGADPKTMAKAAQIICDLHKIAIIDINMGCPVPKVAVRAQAGSSLLKNPENVEKVVRAVVEAVSVPVTVKIRSGWDEKSINAVLIAQCIERAGASAITIHPRTRAQGYSGKADWDIIRDVKKAVSIPVIGNGDVTDCFKAKEMLEVTGCDAVMIGRGVLGDPWLIRDCVNYLESGLLPFDVSFEEKLGMIKRHYQSLVKDKDEKRALLEIRSHVLWYLKGLPSSKSFKAKICGCKSSNEIFKCLDEYKQEIKNNI